MEHRYRAGEHFSVLKNFLKDFVQPKKRGVKSGTNRFISTSYTIADVFQIHLKGYFFALNFKKPFQCLGQKNVESFFTLCALQKTQKRVVMLRYEEWDKLFPLGLDKTLKMISFK